MTISHVSIFQLSLNNRNQINTFERLKTKLTYNVMVKDQIGNLT